MPKHRFDVATDAPSSRRLRFDDFEIDLRSGEVWKHGKRIRLQDQPFQVLRVLLERHGEIVTRDELKQTLWSSDTFVDFDDGLNTAVKKIRDVLGDSSERPRYIETIPRRGYRFICPVETLSLAHSAEQFAKAAAQTASASALTEAAPSKTAFRRGSSISLGVLALVLVLVGSNIGGWRSRVHGNSTAPQIRSLAVLPLKNLSGDATQEYLADGMTEELIGRLAGIHDLRVISRTSVTRFKDTQLSIPEISKMLQVDAIVEGSVIRDGSRIRVHAQLIRASTDEHFWSETYDREMGDILDLQDSVARTIVQQINISLTADQQTKLAGPRILNPEAYEAYLKGRYYWNKRTADGLEKASIYFQQAIDKEPTYGTAYSGLADCNSGLSWHGFKSPAEALPKANAAALKAIEIDPESAEAHASLALVRDHSWDWPGAEAEFKRALQLDPQYANAHHWYANYLSIRGQHDEAIVEAKEALKLDPLNLMIGTWLALRYYFAGQYDHAVEQSRNTVELDPNFAAAHLVLGESYLRTGRLKEGLAELERAATLSGNSPLYRAQVGVAHAVAGKKREALRIISQLQRVSSERYVSAYGLAQVYAALNDKEQTFHWLKAAYEEHSVWMSYLAVDPVYDGVRSDPRFKDLLRRVGLDVGGKRLLVHGNSAAPQIRSLAVLPLKNLSGDATQEYLADGMTEALIGRLAGIHDLRVISRTSSMQFKNTQLSVPEIARTLHVDAIVEGSLIRDGNRIRVHAQLIRASTDEHFWSETYDRELPDVLALQSDVAQSIARRVEVTLTGEENARLRAARSVSPAVYDSYLKGRFGKNNSKAELEQSIGYFEEAIQKDPTFAPAYVGLAAVYDQLGTVFVGAPPSEARAKQTLAAQKALELDPGNAEAHVLLGHVLQRHWQWANAESEYKRALDLAPNDPAAVLGLAFWLHCQGREEEAVGLSRRAHELDPVGASNTRIGLILFESRHYDEAIRSMRSVLQLHPDDAAAHWYLGFALVTNDQAEEAIPVLEKAVSLTDRGPGAIGVLIRAYAQAGQRDKALKLLAELKKRNETGYVPAGAFVNAYLGLGDKEQAFVWLGRGYQEQSNIMQFLKVHPFFDPIRDDPRFKDLLRRVGLDKAQ